MEHKIGISERSCQILIVNNRIYSYTHIFLYEFDNQIKLSMCGSINVRYNLSGKMFSLIFHIDRVETIIICMKGKKIY